jgi:DNA-binding helix-hairpin-helix protein with protein kinase domain
LKNVRPIRANPHAQPLNPITTELRRERAEAFVSAYVEHVRPTEEDLETTLTLIFDMLLKSYESDSEHAEEHLVPCPVMLTFTPDEWGEIEASARGNPVTAVGRLAKFQVKKRFCPKSFASHPAAANQLPNFITHGDRPDEEY